MDEIRYIMENKLTGHNATLPGSRLIDTRIGKNGVTQWSSWCWKCWHQVWMPTG
jgi:hypothetical protein